ncbi:MAG: condensation domain-containing protein, partial [Acidobacteriota bacterium]
MKGLEEILAAYKERKLSTAKVKEKLGELKREFLNKYPLSEGQKGLWALQRTFPEMCAYNIPICFYVSQDLDVDLFKQSCHFIIKKYPLLSSVIQEEDGVLSQ